VTEETNDRRLDRELEELVQELRAMLPGVQVLFAFLLTVPFTNRFDKITALQQDVYFAAFVCAALATVFLIAPASYHRVQFRQRDKEHLLRTGNRQALAGTVFIALGLTGATFVVTDVLFAAPSAAGVSAALFGLAAWLWWGLPVLRRLRD
jgi:predicted neutral ceramidase superfamily lipid hydrolase